MSSSSRYTPFISRNRITLAVQPPSYTSDGLSPKPIPSYQLSPSPFSPSSLLTMPSPEPQQLTLFTPRTNSAQLSAVIDGIAASYFPSSIIPSLAVAIGSASATGDPEAIISELKTASAPPPYLSALPTQYQSRLTVAEGLISSLRSARDR